MNDSPTHKIGSIPLGGLGTGAMDVCADGRIRNLAINNNRMPENRLPEVPHSFLAVRASDGDHHFVRRLQTPLSGVHSPHLLPAGGLKFRGHYPQVDCRVEEPGAPVGVVWSAFAPVVPYDYEASALPVVFFAVQVTNTSDVSLEVSALLNWQNTCGHSAINTPEELAPIGREVVVTDADWNRMTNRGGGDNERRLMASSGQVETTQRRTFSEGEVPPNALVFGGLGDVDSNEDGQYCVVTPWTDACEPSQVIWDPENAASAERFWQAFANDGRFPAAHFPDRPRAGAVCGRLTLHPGESQTVEFVVSWFCPRYAVAGPDEGNFYANAYTDARAVARVGLDNRKYFFAAVSAWQKRFVASDMSSGFVKRLFSSCEVLSTNSIHNHGGKFGLFESLRDPRVNYMRDRWYWSMGLLLFFPRLELEILDHLSEGVFDPESRNVRISDGMEGFSGGEFVGGGAMQIEACAHLVALAYRNFVFGGNLSSVSRIAPRLQAVMAALLAQDKDVDGFPDILQESPGLDGPFARGFNVITAGLWIVALRVYERIARRQKYAEADLYLRAYDRAFRSFDKYFWDRDHGYYTLYPNPGLGVTPQTDWAKVCHIGQLIPIWIAGVLDMPEAFSRTRVKRLLETIETLNIRGDEIQVLAMPEGEEGTDLPADATSVNQNATELYSLIPYLGLKLEKSPQTDVVALFDRFTRERTVQAGGEAAAVHRHVGHLALWYLVAASPYAQLNLSERRLELRPDLLQPGEERTATLYTPNGFGAAILTVTEETPFRCTVQFSMDIPLELATIEILIPGGIAGVQCVLEVEDGPIRIQTILNSLSDSEVRVSVTPQGKLSTPSFTLQLREGAAGEAMATSKKQWLPQWFRK